MSMYDLLQSERIIKDTLKDRGYNDYKDISAIVVSKRYPVTANSKIYIHLTRENEDLKKEIFDILEENEIDKSEIHFLYSKLDEDNLLYPHLIYMAEEDYERLCNIVLNKEWRYKDMAISELHKYCETNKELYRKVILHGLKHLDVLVREASLGADLELKEDGDIIKVMLDMSKNDSNMTIRQMAIEEIKFVIELLEEG